MLKTNEPHLTRRLLSVLLASMVTLTVVGQPPVSRPKLVVGIMIDGLREDYLDLLKGYFGEGGFNRLMQEGVMLENVNYGTFMDATAATAMVYSGTSPSVNGIPASVVYDPEHKRSFPVVLDHSQLGNFTEDTFTPKTVTVSTVSDEVRIDGAGFGNVYSIAPSASQSIVMAGHAGNSALWINDVTGKWSTSTYYKEMPLPVQGRNHSKPLSVRLDTLTWRPLLAPEKYPDLPAYKKYYPFRYLFQHNDINRFRNYKTSGPVNTEITDIAGDYINGLQLGNHDAMDMLNLGYTLAPFIAAKDADHRIETMDSYLRLDKDLERLLKIIDDKVGLENTFVMLAGTPSAPGNKRDDEKWGIPNGEFIPKRAISLLNMYFVAKYGNEEWVAGYHDSQLFLNRKLIQERGLDLAAMRAEAADFLTRMSGVSGVWTIDDVIAGRAGNNAAALKRNTNVNFAGDLLLAITPGWEIVEIDPVSAKEIRSTVRSGIMAAPVFLYSPVLKPSRIIEEIDARSIAPTVARLLRIRSPNAADLPPLALEKK
ncbi:alkaline phosphatase family protein [uncultured Muribaculum sp.]|uniref:alkaline phosphatase family protein n=1 Tax=uncultured Muribaculum sp. TaxID=1918613 RepID=UPI002594D9C7|nr:alkaline phosphatase family protein [uncultured Muribaculum sp.]